jgi:DUF4097 and DUF4098 domain-containing protein YvlB
MSVQTETQTESPTDSLADSQVAARPRRRGLWLLVAACSAALVIVAVGVPVFGWVADQSSTTTWTAVHPITDVVVDIGSGDVSIVPGPAGSVSLVQTLTWSTARPKVTETWSGATLVIREECSAHSLFATDDCGASLRLTVPTATAVQASAASGDVTVSELSGDLHVQVTSGDADFVDDTGYVWARTESGSVNGSRLRSQRVNVAAISGDIGVTFAVAPTTVDVAVTSGDATVAVPHGAMYRVAGQTVSGDRSVEPLLVDDTSTHSITIDSVSGDAELGYSD